ncbi:MAG: hydrogenase iron-sulfur subunit [Dehalococcoidia bacterium]|nr:MAG: hydrogenase iron-sulfur subunit [Dehalococcoidia bacterium]
MNDFKPNIVIFHCNFCAPIGAERLLASKLKDNFRPRIIKTNCAGRIDPTFILDAFAKGADGVMVVGDHPGDCHFVSGNYKARRNIMLLKNMLPQLGIEPHRLRAEWITSEAPKFLSSLNEFVDEVTSLGPLKVN